MAKRIEPDSSDYQKELEDLEKLERLGDTAGDQASSDVDLVDFQKDLEKLESLDENDKGQDEADIATAYECFTPKFMHKHTRYGDFQKLLAAGNLKVKTVKDLKAVPIGELNRLIKKTTDFSSWSEMQEAGMMEFIDEEL